MGVFGVYFYTVITPFVAVLEDTFQPLCIALDINSAYLDHVNVMQN